MKKLSQRILFMLFENMFVFYRTFLLVMLYYMYERKSITLQDLCVILITIWCGR